jgi:hypothetical protein
VATGLTSIPFAGQTGHSAFDLFRKQNKQKPIFTLCQQLDKMLGDGIRPAQITEFCRASSHSSLHAMYQQSANFCPSLHYDRRSTRHWQNATLVCPSAIASLLCLPSPLCGPFASGSMQIACDVSIPLSLGNACGSAVYIGTVIFVSMLFHCRYGSTSFCVTADTEGSFMPERAAEIAQGLQSHMKNLADKLEV